jgi:hypothetical protein
VEHRAVLRDVDVLPAEHRVAVRGHPAFVSQPQEQLEGLVGDPVLRVVEEEPGSFGDQALAAIRVLPEELAQVPSPDFGVMALERLPRLGFAELAQAARRSDSDLIVSSRSVQDLTKASAPSF